MAARPRKIYRLGDLQLKPDERRLCRGDETIHLTARPFQVLLHLIENRERVVTRQELLDLFWDGREVYDDTLRKCVSAIRKALDDRPDNPRFIETLYGEGYRYVGPLQDQAPDDYDAGAGVVDTTSNQMEVCGEMASTLVEPQDSSLAEPAGNPGRTSRSQFRQTIVWLLLLAALTLAAGALFQRNHGGRAAANPPDPIRSVAVLPFKNLAADQSPEYFSDGLAESFISELTRIDGLRVISRVSAFTFRDKDVDVREVGKKLDVESVLEGSVRYVNDHVRIDVRLVSTQDGGVIWTSPTYDRELKDIFAIQDEIACSVVSSLKVKLCPEQARPARHQTDNAEAYQAYLMGLYFFNKRSKEGIEKAIGHFERAISLDHNYGLACAGLADCYLQGIWYVPFESNQAIARARSACERALQIDESLGEAHTMLATVYSGQWDWPASEREFRRALELNPNSARIHHMRAYRLATTGRVDEAIAEIGRARELDPLNLVINADVAEILYFAHRYDDAIQQARKTLDMDPSFAMAQVVLGKAYLGKGMHAEAIAAGQRAVALWPENSRMAIDLAIVYGAAGQKDRTRATLRKLKEESKKAYVPSIYFAPLYIALGEKEQAFLSLEKAYAERSTLLINLKIDPAYEGLRPDPRFTDLLRRVGLSD